MYVTALKYIYIPQDLNLFASIEIFKQQKHVFSRADIPIYGNLGVPLQESQIKIEFPRRGDMNNDNKKNRKHIII